LTDKQKEAAREANRRFRKNHPDKVAADRLRRKDSQKVYFKQYREKYEQQRREIISSLGYDRCSKCGYNKCLAAIEFHHLDPHKKEFNIGDFFRMNGRKITKEKLEIFITELKKCVPLCRNCHAELHYSY
jgi:hypothetical protein